MWKQMKALLAILLFVIVFFGEGYMTRKSEAEVMEAAQEMEETDMATIPVIRHKGTDYEVEDTQARQNVSDIKSAIMHEYDITGSLLIDNKMIDTDGKEASTSAWCASDYVDVFGSGGCYADIDCTIYGTAAMAWYDKSKTKIGYISSDNCESYGITASLNMQTVKILLPSNVAYIRCCAYKNNMGGETMRVAVGSFNDGAMVKAIQNSTEENTGDLSIVKNFIGKTKWKNLINPEEVTEKAYIKKSDGTLVTGNQYNNATGFIYLEPNETYYVKNVLLNNNYAFYTAPDEASFISEPDVTFSYSGDPAWEGTITTHDTAYYYRGSQGRDPQLINPYISNYVNTYLPYGIVTMNDMIPQTAITGKVLVIGDSISSDAYGNYKKWVTNLIESGLLQGEVTNSSQHATGFVATSSGSYPSFISRIEGIQDKSSYDMVIVFGGINDYIQNIPMGGESGQTDKTVYFKQAVDYFFQYLVNNFTQARICVLLPLRTYNTNPNTQGKYQQEYGEYIKTVAKYYCMPILNLTEESGFCPFIESFRNMWTLVPAGYSEADGVHPNAEYEKKYLAPMIWKFINGLMN